MYPDPQRFSEVDLQNEVNFRRQQVAASRRKGLPIIVQVLLLPFLLIARGSMWTWRKVFRRG